MRLALRMSRVSRDIGSTKNAPGQVYISWKLADTCIFSSGLMSCKHHHKQDVDHPPAIS